MLLVSRGFLTCHKLLFQKMTAAILLAIPSTFLLITLMMIANKAFRYRSSASPIHPVSAPALIFQLRNAAAGWQIRRVHITNSPIKQALLHHRHY